MLPTVEYPDKGIIKDNKVIKDYQTSAQGRNGYIKQAGLQVFHSPMGVIRLSPVTSKGSIANCCIEIPDQPEVINKVIKLLKQPEGSHSEKFQKVFDELEAHYGDWKYEDSKYPREDWQQEAWDGETQLGYFDWLRAKYEIEEHNEPVQGRP